MEEWYYRQCVTKKVSVLPMTDSPIRHGLPPFRQSIGIGRYQKVSASGPTPSTPGQTVQLGQGQRMLVAGQGQEDLNAQATRGTYLNILV